MYYLPFSNRKDLLGTLLGGFEISPIFTWNTGLPWTPVTYRYCIPQPGNCISPTRPTEVLMNPIYSNSNYALTHPDVNFPGGGSAFFATPAGTKFPAINRNSFRGPDFRTLDLSVAKNFRLDTFHLPEASRLQLRANFYNIFNLLNLSNFQFGDASTNINDPSFGRALTATSGRVVELEGRFEF